MPTKTTTATKLITWKLRVVFIRWGFLGLQAQDAASQVALEKLLWGGGGSEGVVGGMGRRGGGG